MEKRYACVALTALFRKEDTFLKGGGQSVCLFHPVWTNRDFFIKFDRNSTPFNFPSKTAKLYLQ